MMTEKERLLIVISNLDGYYITALKKAGFVTDAATEKIFQEDIDTLREISETMK